MSTETDTLPVFIVKGINWICEVQLDEDDYLNEYNKPFSLEEMAMEAATKSLERLLPLWRPSPEDENADRGFGYDNGVEFDLLNDNAPSFGILLAAFPKGMEENENSAIFVKSYEALANGGYYEISKKMYQDYLKHEKELNEALEALNKNKSKSKKKRKK